MDFRTFLFYCQRHASNSWLTLNLSSTL